MALIGALMGAATEGTPYRALAQVAAAAVGGALTYVGLCAVLRVEALGFFVSSGSNGSENWPAVT
jgi:hypothetical protein